MNTISWEQRKDFAASAVRPDLCSSVVKLLPILTLLTALTWATAGKGPLPPVEAPQDPALLLARPVDLARTPRATRFVLPMGGEEGALIYNAQPFGVTRHLGDDWNGIGGRNSDLGEPVFAAADGLVLLATNPSAGWGHFVLLQHVLADGTPVQTAYAHLETMEARVGSVLARGEPLGTVGTAAGKYLAHLHYEVRRQTALAPGAGYDDQPLDRVSPTRFTAPFRPRPILPPSPLRLDRTEPGMR
jgi:murein DD-endopeptidase MepM/ murein hydrolase activator NlpD